MRLLCLGDSQTATLRLGWLSISGLYEDLTIDFATCSGRWYRYLRQVNSCISICRDAPESAIEIFNRARQGSRLNLFDYDLIVVSSGLSPIDSRALYHSFPSYLSHDCLSRIVDSLIFGPANSDLLHHCISRSWIGCPILYLGSCLPAEFHRDASSTWCLDKKALAIHLSNLARLMSNDFLFSTPEIHSLAFPPLYLLNNSITKTKEHLFVGGWSLWGNLKPGPNSPYLDTAQACSYVDPYHPGAEYGKQILSIILNRFYRPSGVIAKT